MTQRTIVKRALAVGTYYIPINRYAQNITVQANPAGGANVAVDYTTQNVIRGPTSSYDSNNEEFIAPASAQWTQLIAGGGVAVAFNGSVSAYCLRVVVSVSGTCDITISQTSETL